MIPNIYFHVVRLHRALLINCTLFFGKTKVMAVALGLSSESEPYSNTSQLAPYLQGSVGLIFSPRKSPDMLSYFANFQPADNARSGTIAPRNFILPLGTLYSRAGEIPREEDVPLAHSVEPVLRKLGVPTKMVKGRVELDNDFVVCRAGEVLGSGQTALLKTFGVAIATFKIQLVACFDSVSGQVEAFKPDDMQQVQEMDVDDAPSSE